MGLGLGIDSGLRLRPPSTALSGAALAVPLSGGARPPTPGRRLGPCDSAVARDFKAAMARGWGLGEGIVPVHVLRNEVTTT